jgi:CheY-like chemotaxis protein
MPTGALRIRNLLVVEDDPDTSHLLKTYFSGHGYEVAIAGRGSEALETARKQAPDLVLLDIILPEPELDGLAVCQALRSSARTSHIPIVFLTEKAAASDRLIGLSAGAQDYITKPFDLEELRLRVKNLITRAERENMLDPRTGLPTGNVIDDQLKRLAGQAGWWKVECRIDAFRPFVDRNGFAAGDDVLKFTAHLLREMVNANGTAEDFIGHPANDTFLALTSAKNVAEFSAKLTARFNEEVKAHYGFMDREQGYVLIRDAAGQQVQAPLMTLKVTTAAL